MTNKLMTATLVVSGATIVSLIHDINTIRKETDVAIEKITYTHLVAMLYVLKDPNYKNQFNKFKEAKTMKKISMSNRTKVILGATIALGAAAAISAVIDNREISAIENETDLEIIDLLPAAESIEGAAEAVNEIVE